MSRCERGMPRHGIVDPRPPVRRAFRGCGAVRDPALGKSSWPPDGPADRIAEWAVDDFLIDPACGGWGPLPGRRVRARRAFLAALGRRIRRLRSLAELTKSEVAAATGVPRRSVSLIEHGAHGVDVVRLLRLADVFGMTLVELLDLDTPVRIDHEAA